MTSPWFDFWPKFVLSLANVGLVAGVGAFVAFKFNRMLEKHRRNEAITAEVAKRSIDGYLRVLESLSVVNGMLFTHELTGDEAEAHRPAAKGKAKPGGEDLLGDPDVILKTAFHTIFEKAPYVNETFVSASLGFVGFATRHLDEYWTSAREDSKAQEKLRGQKAAMLSAVGKTLPAYVRLPDENLFRFGRPIEDIFLEVGIWRRTPAGEVVGAD
jgi:hypothetical protein